MAKRNPMKPLRSSGWKLRCHGDVHILINYTVRFSAMKKGRFERAAVGSILGDVIGEMRPTVYHARDVEPNSPAILRFNQIML